MLIQILLTSLLVPKTQNLSRELLTTSNVDFFESFIKPQKFIDNIKGLTIYADKKDNDNNLKNIYLKKETGSGNFQITYAKNGFFKIKGESKILVLQNGETINGINNKFSSFNFIQSEFNLAQLDSGVIKVNKIQETSTIKIINCLFKKNVDNELCNNRTSKKEFAPNLIRRLVLPLYIPSIVLICAFLVLKTRKIYLNRLILKQMYVF